MTKKIILILLLVTFYGCTRNDDKPDAPSANPEKISAIEQGEKTRSELNCGESTLISIATCIRQTNTWVDCTDQTIKLSSHENIETRLFQLETYYSAEYKKEYIDHTVGRWACINNKYFFLEYTNGGNCSDCEWFEMIDQNGSRLSYSEDIKIAKSRFQAKYDELGIKKWPRKSFVKVKLAP